MKKGEKILIPRLQTAQMCEADLAMRATRTICYDSISGVDAPRGWHVSNHARATCEITI